MSNACVSFNQITLLMKALYQKSSFTALRMLKAGDTLGDFIRRSQRLAKLSLVCHLLRVTNFADRSD